MKYLIFFFGVISLVSCNNKNSHNYTNTTMTEEEWQNSKPQDVIAIETTFEPTLELTDEILNTSLEDLIKQKKGKYCPKEQIQIDNEIQRLIKEKGVSMSYARFIAEQDFQHHPHSLYYIEPPAKHIPKTSALAKVYYLEDMGAFIRNNSDFYNKVLKEIDIETEKQREKEILDKWDKYL